jgi:SAM-dependent methyltransferase
MVGVTDHPGPLASVRAQSFGAAAADYDRYRPRYPDELVDDVVALLPGRRILEVGAGTGIATVAFADRGMLMTCVEPDPQMAAVLSAKLAGVELRVELATFEDWSAARPAGAPGFDGLISGQAWHWTDPGTRWADAAKAVRGGGVIALFWNEDHYVDPRVPAAYTAAYDRHGIEIRAVYEAAASRSEPDEGEPDESWPEVHAEAAGYFTDLRRRWYRWTRRMPVRDYVTRINTTSQHLVMSPEVREVMSAELVATLTGYGDEIELAMRTELATAIRR